MIASHAAHGVLLLRGKDKPKKGKPAHWQVNLVLSSHTALVGQAHTWPMRMLRIDHTLCVPSVPRTVREIISIIYTF